MRGSKRKKLGVSQVRPLTPNRCSFTEYRQLPLPPRPLLSSAARLQAPKIRKLTWTKEMNSEGRSMALPPVFLMRIWSSQHAGDAHRGPRPSTYARATSWVPTSAQVEFLDDGRETMEDDHEPQGPSALMCPQKHLERARSGSAPGVAREDQGPFDAQKSVRVRIPTPCNGCSPEMALAYI